MERTLLESGRRPSEGKEEPVVEEGVGARILSEEEGEMVEGRGTSFEATAQNLS